MFNQLFDTIANDMRGLISFVVCAGLGYLIFMEIFVWSVRKQQKREESGKVNAVKKKETEETKKNAERDAKSNKNYKGNKTEDSQENKDSKDYTDGYNGGYTDGYEDGISGETMHNKGMGSSNPTDKGYSTGYAKGYAIGKSCMPNKFVAPK